jgi:hypothetical protein
MSAQCGRRHAAPGRRRKQPAVRALTSARRCLVRDGALTTYQLRWVFLLHASMGDHATPLCTACVLSLCTRPCHLTAAIRAPPVRRPVRALANCHRTKRHDAGLVIVQGLLACIRAAVRTACVLSLCTRPCCCHLTGAIRAPPLRRPVRALANCHREKRHSAGLVTVQGLLACIRGRSRSSAVCTACVLSLCTRPCHLEGANSSPASASSRSCTSNIEQGGTAPVL